MGVTMANKKHNWKGSQTLNSILTQTESYETYNEWLTKDRPPHPEVSKEEYEKQLHEYITESYKDSIDDAVTNAILWKFQDKIKSVHITVKRGLISIDSTCGVTKEEVETFIKELQNETKK